MDTPVTPPTPNLSDDESRKKYIRTYAGDMEIVKRGGTPDLKPLESTPEPVIKESIPFVSSPTPPPPETVVPPPPAPPPPPPVEVPIPPPPPAPPPPPPEPPPPTFVPPAPPPIPIESWPKPELAETPPPPRVRPPPPVQFPEPTSVRAPEINASPLETYASDFLDKVKDTRASTATVLAAQEDSGATPQKVVKKTSGWTMFAIVAGVVLLVGGGVGVYIAYTHYLVKTAPVVIAPTLSSPIPFDQQQELSGNTPAAILQGITDSTSQPLPQNDIRLLYTAVSTTTGNDIFSALEPPAPGILLRNIISSGSMAGIINADGTPSPFFILDVTSYQDTFAGMLSWESTMVSDLSPLFPPYPQITPPTVATTTPATNAPPTKSKTKVKTSAPVATTTPPPALPVAGFDDETVGNHNVRVYRDQNGQSVLIYGYWNQTTLIIARDPAAFTEILSRFGASNSQ